MNEARFNELEDYRTSPLFSEAEHAALDYVTELTEEKKVNPGTFARLRQFYSERGYARLRGWLQANMFPPDKHKVSTFIQTCSAT